MLYCLTVRSETLMDNRRPLRSLHPMLIWGFLLWAGSYFAVRVWLEGNPGGPVGVSRVLLALTPLPFFIVMLLGLLTEVRRMDEMHRRIQFEALAVAFPVTLVLIMTLGLVEVAQPLDTRNWSFRHIWPFLVLSYSIGLALAMRRYRVE